MTRRPNIRVEHGLTNDRKKNRMPRKQMIVAIEEADKEAFAELCAAYGLSMASVIGMIVRACVESGKLPFDFISESKKGASK